MTRPVFRLHTTNWLVRPNRIAANVLAACAGLGLVGAKLFVDDSDLRGTVYVASTWVAVVAASFWMSAEGHREEVTLRWFLQRFAIGMLFLPLIFWAIATSPRWLKPALVVGGLTLLFAGTKPLRDIWRELTNR